MKGYRFLVAVGFVVALAAGCGAAIGERAPAAGTFTGTLDYVELEGGFWALRAESGERYVLVGAEGEVEAIEPGTRVVVEGTPRPDRASIQMWGTLLEVETLTAVP